MSAVKGVSISWIGLGLMGKPMSRRLHDAGASVTIHNRSRPVVDELEAQGMRPARSGREAAKASDVVFIMVSDTAAMEAVLWGVNGVGEGIRPGSLVIDMGTSTVASARQAAERLAKQDVAFIDAPVSGGMIGAENGSLSIMVGANVEDLARAKPLFNELGQNITHVGAVGAGQVAKAANQVIVGLNIGAVAEALSLAKKAGVDPARVRAALSGGFADSRILEVHGQRMIENQFTPGGRAVIQRKDLFQALELAESVDLELPATRLNMALYDQLIDAGHGDLDHSALIKAIIPEGVG